jgi:16S rRNA (uracil1498-N3)-methyltransferase
MYIYLPSIFRSELIAGQTLKICLPESRHLSSLRPKPKQKFVATDLKGGLLLVQIESFYKNKQEIELKILYKLKSEFKEKSRLILQAKTDKLYQEKIVELLPFIDAKICFFDSQFSPKGNLKQDRLDKILIRSCEQSQTSLKPQILSAKNLQEVLETFVLNKKINLDKKSICQVLHTQKPKLKEKSELKDLEPKKYSKNSDQQIILIGPEGGWSQQEIDLFEELDLEFVFLGSKIYPAWLAGFAYFSSMTKAS